MHASDIIRGIPIVELITASANCSFTTCPAFARGPSVIFWTIRAECSGNDAVVVANRPASRGRNVSESRILSYNIYFSSHVKRENVGRTRIIYCHKCVNISSCLSRGQVRLKHYKFSTVRSAKMSLGVLQGGTRGLMIRLVVVLCEEIVRRCRKIWVQNRGEGIALEDFAVLFIRSRRFLAKSAAYDRTGLPDRPLLRPFHVTDIMKINNGTPQTYSFGS